MQLEIHKGSKGYYVQYPDGFKREDVEPPACGWFEKRPDAEAEALRLAKATGKGFLIVRVVSKCIPWHCHGKAPNALAQGRDACGASLAATGCAANVTTENK